MRKLNSFVTYRQTSENSLTLNFRLFFSLHQYPIRPKGKELISKKLIFANLKYLYIYVILEINQTKRE